MSVHGIVLIHNDGGCLKTTSLIQVIPVIEHTCLATWQLMERVKAHVLGWKGLSILHVVSDCGPSYCCLEWIARLGGEEEARKVQEHKGPSRLAKHNFASVIKKWKGQQKGLETGLKLD